VCRAERTTSIDSLRAHLATSQVRWPGEWTARASRTGIRFLATRLRHEPVSRVLAKKIAIAGSNVSNAKARR
jgi:hypothetical protein